MRRAAALGFLLAVGAGAVVHPKAAHSKAAQHRRAQPPPPKFDPAVVNNPATQDQLGPGANGSAVLRAEILLDRVHFSPGEIDGRWGANLEGAVRAFQTAHGVNASGVIDTATWQALNSAQNPQPNAVQNAPPPITVQQNGAAAPAAQPPPAGGDRPPLVQYTIAPQDTTGPFEKVPPKMLDQAKLHYLGYESPLEELAERFHSSPRLLKALNPDKDFSKAGESIEVPDVQRIPLDATQVTHVVVKADCGCVEAADAQGRVLAHYPATMGSTHDPLPLGEYHLQKPDLNPVFHYDPSLFWNATDSHGAKIAPGPNNPVGLCWIGLDKKHYGIHGTPDPALIGKSFSHGCIRLTNWDVLDLANLVKPGMDTVLQQS